MHHSVVITAYVYIDLAVVFSSFLFFSQHFHVKTKANRKWRKETNATAVQIGHTAFVLIYLFVFCLFFFFLYIYCRESSFEGVFA